MTKWTERLWAMLEDPSSKEIIFWVDDGTAFAIRSQHEFEVHMQQFYDTASWGTFLRSLNLYHFRRLPSEVVFCKYSHPHFRRDKPEERSLVKRALKRGSDHHAEEAGERESLSGENDGSDEGSGRAGHGVGSFTAAAAAPVSAPRKLAAGASVAGKASKGAKPKGAKAGGAGTAATSAAAAQAGAPAGKKRKVEHVAPVESSSGHASSTGGMRFAPAPAPPPAPFQYSYGSPGESTGYGGYPGDVLLAQQLGIPVPSSRLSPPAPSPQSSPQGSPLLSGMSSSAGGFAGLPAYLPPRLEGGRATQPQAGPGLHAPAPAGGKAAGKKGKKGEPVVSSTYGGAAAGSSSLDMLAGAYARSSRGPAARHATGGTGSSAGGAQEHGSGGSMHAAGRKSSISGSPDSTLMLGLGSMYPLAASPTGSLHGMGSSSSAGAGGGTGSTRAGTGTDMEYQGEGHGQHRSMSSTAQWVKRSQVVAAGAQGVAVSINNTSVVNAPAIAVCLQPYVAGVSQSESVHSEDATEASVLASLSSTVNHQGGSGGGREGGVGGQVGVGGGAGTAALASFAQQGTEDMTGVATAGTVASGAPDDALNLLAAMQVQAGGPVRGMDVSFRSLSTISYHGGGSGSQGGGGAQVEDAALSAADLEAREGAVLLAPLSDDEEGGAGGGGDMERTTDDDDQDGMNEEDQRSIGGENEDAGSATGSAGGGGRERGPAGSPTTVASAHSHGSRRSSFAYPYSAMALPPVSSSGRPPSATGSAYGSSTGGPVRKGSTASLVMFGSGKSPLFGAQSASPYFAPRAGAVTMAWPAALTIGNPAISVLDQY